MSRTKLMELAESLAELDPLSSYRRRGAEQIARAASASGYRLYSSAGECWRDASPGPGTPDLSLPLRFRREKLGEIHLFLPPSARLSREELRVVRWAARLYARGLKYGERLGRSGRSDAASVEASLGEAPLTPREREVVRQLATGAATRDIARAMGVTPQTVNTYLKRVYAKTGVRSRVELLARLVPGSAASVALRARSD